MPGCVVCARLVDIIDRQAGKRQEEYTFWPDVLECFGLVYKRENFADNIGGYFPAYKSDPLKYVEPCSDAVKGWFKKLKDAGKVTFLLTSSHVDYAESLLENILGKDWQEYFHISMMYARKPGYFTKEQTERPFYSIVDNKEGDEVSEIQTGGKYLQGSIHTFNSYLKKMTGKENPKVAYFGDSVRSDVLPPQSVGWHPFLILEEMEAEGLGEEPMGGEQTDGPPIKRGKITGPSTTEKEFITSSMWGSFLTDQTVLNIPDGSVHTGGDELDGQSDANGLGDSQFHSLNTLWGYFIQTYVDVAIPQLDYIADLPLDHQFSTFADASHRSAGFYPQPPQTLQKM
ncbi:5'-nucleotidase domain-containing protein 1-like [Strongylocentrotus purpuratus]|uniref:5'-nucleotidase domain-containing protein 1 n=1 Tax=Strongylocentrotus purpuratus TaxID=7668 RepID=A0A7M7PGN9_STRPU|nr:5'-nucleotidase domain-containing protein 1-like [Strongylocentrotus purpuratus]